MKSNSSMPLKSWLPLVGLTCSTFIFNTSEFIPIGLLTDIAADFCMTEAQAGMLISVYAWVVMLLSLPLMILASRIELRRLLLCLIGFFSAFQVMSFLSSGYWMLMASRIGVACTHSIFWSIVSPVAVKIVSDEHRPLALGMIVTGSSIAMILGMPLGRVIGLHIGWRMTFLSIGLFAFATFLYLLFVLPKVQSDGVFSPRRLPELFRNRALAGLFLFTALYAGSYYTCYSYIEPFLKQVVGMSDELVTASLMIFGGAGLVGSFLFSKYYRCNSRLFTTLVMVSITASLMLFYSLAVLSTFVQSPRAHSPLCVLGHSRHCLQCVDAGRSHQPYGRTSRIHRRGNVDILGNIQHGHRLRLVRRRPRLHPPLTEIHRLRGRHSRRPCAALLASAPLRPL